MHIGDLRIYASLQYIPQLISCNGQGTLSMAYVCKLCGNKFSIENDAKVHIHNVHTIHVCNICDKIFNDKDNLEKHKEVLHSLYDSKDLTPVVEQLCSDTNSAVHCSNPDSASKPNACIIPVSKNNSFSINEKCYDKQLIICQLCDKVFSSKNKKFYLHEHMEEIHSVRPNKSIKCCINGCSSSFNALKQLRMHLMDPEDTGGHNCIIAKRKEVIHKTQGKEMNAHYTPNANVSKYCKKKYYTNTALQKNYTTIPLKNVNLGEQKIKESQYSTKVNVGPDGLTYLEYVCNICGKIYSNEPTLRKHIESIHNSTEIYKCNICNKVLSNMTSLERHKQTRRCKSKILQKTISSEIKKKFICQICNKGFSTKWALNNHIKKIHSIPRQLRRDINCCMSSCSESFKSLDELRKHLMKQDDAGGHNVLLEKEEYIFNNIEEFDKWKENLERSNNIRYVVRTCRKTKDGSARSVLYCHHLGKYSYRGIGKRMTKEQGTLKIGTHCPSGINIICSIDGIVKCKYYKTHIGHETSGTDIKPIEISKKDKLFIIEKRLEGIEKKRILHELHMKGGRSALIKESDMCNILNSDLFKDLEICRDSHNFNVYRKDVGKYEVSNNNKGPCEVIFSQYCSCSKKCLKCDVCTHSYICNCEEYNKMIRCKHIHAVSATKFAETFRESFKIPNENHRCDEDERDKKIKEANILLNRIKSSLSKCSIEQINEKIEHMKKIDAQENPDEWMSQYLLLEN